MRSSTEPRRLDQDVRPAIAEHPSPRGGGIAAWSIHHPVGVTMIALAVVVVGALSLERLRVNLLPHIIYPEIQVRINDPGVPAKIIEDQITRQLEEQLAITEDAVSVQSRSREGRSSVTLSFEYGKDIDLALRDASTRLDRAKRFLPDSIDPPVIFKRDPSQIPITELVVSSPLRDPVELRTWVDDVFAKRFLNLPGVAAAEVGGGVVREVRVLPDRHRLAGLGLTIQDLVDALKENNVESPGGRLTMANRELSGRTSGRFRSVAEIAHLPLETTTEDGDTLVVRLEEVAQVIDAHEDERVRIRLNRVPGIKISIQKQPQANTVAVVDAVNDRLAWLESQDLLPTDIEVQPVADQAVYVRNALGNATRAALSGALLAMAVVYLFLGNLRRTLIIGSVIPIAIMVTLALMDAAGLTLNITTLGGLALGVGLLVDNTIVMLENIYRHQRDGEPSTLAPVAGAAEVNSAIVASTSTNLAAILPFLFVTGLVGLLFRELIATISAAILASLVVALTLVPALAARVPVTESGQVRRLVDSAVDALQRGYGRIVSGVLRVPWLPPLAFLIALGLALPVFQSEREVFLPKMDEGRMRAYLTSDAGVSLDETDRIAQQVEELFLSQPEVQTVYGQIGGFVFGRSQYEASNRSSLSVQLKPLSERAISTEEWIQRVRESIDDLKLVGVKVYMRNSQIRGVRVGSGDDDISIRVQGPDLETLANIGDQVAKRLDSVAGIRNVEHTYEDIRQELSVVVDRERAATLGLNVDDIGRGLRLALEGDIVTDFIEGDRKFNVRLRVPETEMSNLSDLESILVYGGDDDRGPVYLGDVAKVQLVTSPSEIFRDSQQRMVEITASLAEDATLGEVSAAIDTRLEEFDLPRGYTLYDGGGAETLQQSRNLSQILLALALFLVLVVMAVQYESLRNPLVIIVSVPFAAIGVAIAIATLDLPLSMPLWLGMIMLAGIVVNNAIVLVEYIEIERKRGHAVREAIVRAARLRLRPILMTTLTTAVGMAPLAFGIGEGAEMLRPLAITIVYGLSFSVLVSLLLVPAMYRLICGGRGSPG